MRLKNVLLMILVWGICLTVAKADVVISLSMPGADSVAVFKFKTGSNVFMPAMFGNEKSTTQIKSWQKRFQKEIGEGKCRFEVESFCKDFEEEQKNTEIARQRSLFVKGYLIGTLGLKEKNFTTRNRPVESAYDTEKAGVAVKKAVVYLPEVREAPDTVVVFQTRIVRDTIVKEVIREVYPEPEESQQPEIAPVVKIRPEAALGNWLVKTNLLKWLTLTPEAEVEYRFHPNWSVGVEAQWTHLNWDNGDKTYRLALGSPELRYYFGEKSCLNGMFAGLYYRGGKFNYMPGATGYQGSLHGGGLSFGYLKPLCSRLFVEFSGGVGFTHYSYDRYTRAEGKDIFELGDICNRWGVTKAKVSVGWSLSRK